MKLKPSAHAKHAEHDIHTPTTSVKKHREEVMMKKVEHAKFAWKKKAEEAEFEEHEEEVQHDEEQVVKGLSAIYVDERTGEVPDLGKMERRRSWWWVKFLLILTLVSSVLSFAAWMGFFYLRPFEDVSVASTTFSLNGPTSITIGEEQTFEVKYRNEGLQPLRDAEIRILWPTDFQVTSLSPEPADVALHRWQVGLLPVGMEGKIVVKGVFVGAVGGQGSVQAFMTYRSGSMDQPVEQVLQTHPVAYAGTVLGMKVDAPVKVLSEDRVPVQVQVTNTGAQALGDLWVRIQTPLGFDVQMASSTLRSQFSSSTREWFVPLSVLEPKTTSTVMMTGGFPLSLFGDMPFRVEVGKRSTSTFVAYQAQDVTVPVLVGDLTLKVVANGKDGDLSVEPGESLHVSLAYQNTSPEVLKQTVIKLQFESIVDGKSTTGTSLVDWNTVQLSVAGATSTKARLQTVTYDKTTVPELDSLPSQAEGIFDVSIPTKLLATSSKDGVIVVTGLATVSQVGASKVNRTVQTRPVRIRYRTDASITAEGRYFSEEGAPMGFGPVPPVAGKTTAYRVYWKLQKRWHGLKDVKVTATLPRRVAWSALTGAEAGQLSYVSSTREVSWTIKQVPEQTKDVEAWFEVQLTPDEVDVGRFADLLSESNILFTDELVGEQIVRIQPPITTDLPEDDGAKGKGVVRAKVGKE